MKAQIAMVLGDPAGIGPELVAKLLAEPETCRQADVFLIASKEAFLEGQTIAGVEVPFLEAASFEAADFSQSLPVLMDYSGEATGPYPIAEATAQGGRYCLETLKVAVELTAAGKTDAVCFAPLNKSALHLAGMTQSDELHWFADLLDFDGYVCELNVLEELWTSRVTSHVALKEVSGLLSAERVVKAVALIDRSLRQAGVARPRIAVCGLNPHCGDNGNFGREELDIIGPGVEQARQAGIPADGPFPADTIFLKARAGDYDAVVTMYHDQGQTAMKLMGFDRGVSVQGGLPIPITTPAHGTAFDIAGQNKANVRAMREAFRLACRLGLHYRASRQ